jgi:hypothetical protein
VCLVFKTRRVPQPYAGLVGRSFNRY